MNLSFTIAKRYLLGKKSHNIINIISMVSVSGVLIGAMALVIVLSVFNGFGDLVISLYDTFDPDIKITVHEGKIFSASAINLEELKKTEGIKFVSLSLEENALVKCNDRQYIATVKGVDETFLKVSGINKKIILDAPIARGSRRHAPRHGAYIAAPGCARPESAVQRRKIR